MRIKFKLFNKTQQKKVKLLFKKLTLLDIVISKGTAIFQLLPSKDQSLLIRRNPFLVLDFGFDIVNSITRFDLKSDGLASQGFHKNLHSAKCEATV